MTANADRFIGSWELIPELSLYATGTPPLSGSYRIEMSAPAVLAFSVRWKAGSDTDSLQATFGGACDGVPIPIPGAPPGTPDAFSITLVDEGTLDSTALRDGLPVAYARRRLANDGMLMAVVQERTVADGTRLRDFQLYRRNLDNERT